ncbi:hypothetical protein RND71_003396 [Anisodus tanguticus]|uniref:Uncharacterized protein n=1 Tax=Anisodus tanguticus TaxID=243964 RepID=A0AAE1SVT1_9SOLA|nr:hypothetical protein RND71_003396 [Anisodus tanguticus]
MSEFIGLFAIDEHDWFVSGGFWECFRCRIEVFCYISLLVFNVRYSKTNIHSGGSILAEGWSLKQKSRKWDVLQQRNWVCFGEG